MAKNRLIFTLLMQEGVYQLSRNFSLQAVGDLNWIKEHYNFNAIAFSIDELIVLNVVRGQKNVEKFSSNLIELNKNCFMPITAGGGIRSLDDAYLLLNSGADKLVINTPLIKDPELVKSLVKTFGSQCIVASIDYKVVNGQSEVFIENADVPTGLTIEETVKTAHDIGCGEIYLTSVERDGTGEGLDLEVIKKVSESSLVPVIAAGGIGKYEHFCLGIQEAKAEAVATANLFNFIADGLIYARVAMNDAGIEMACWDFGLKKENFVV